MKPKYTKRELTISMNLIEFAEQSQKILEEQKREMTFEELTELTSGTYFPNFHRLKQHQQVWNAKIEADIEKTDGTKVVAIYEYDLKTPIYFHNIFGRLSDENITDEDGDSWKGIITEFLKDADVDYPDCFCSKAMLTLTCNADIRSENLIHKMLRVGK